MPSLRQVAFDGIKPAVNTLNARAQQAQIAHNVNLRDTTICPIREPAERETCRHFGDEGTVKDVYLVPNSDDCCGGPVTFDRMSSVIQPADPGHCAGFKGVVVFPCGCGDPYRYFKCEDETYPLVVPQPQTTLGYALAGQGTDYLNPEGYHGPDQRSYTYTWVDQFGVESPPALPTATFPSFDDQTFELTGFDTPPPNATCVRIYRIAPHFEGDGADQPQFDTDFHLVEEVDITGGFSGTYLDDTKSCDMAFGTLTTEMDCPPPCMDRVVMTESGQAVGFEGNQLFVSERHEPHNWPEKFRLELPHRIVAIDAFYDWIMVGTTGRPYRVNVVPTEAGNEADTRIEALPYQENFPVVAPKSFVATNFGAIYASRRGLVALAPQGNATLISRDRIDEADWPSWAPNIAAWRDGKYYGSRSPNGRSFILDVAENAEGPLDVGDLVTIDWNPCAVHSGSDGRLWYADQEGNLLVWGEGTKPLTYCYKSREFRSNGLMAFNTAKVVGDYGPPVQLTIYCEGEEYFQTEACDSCPLRIRPNGRGLRWSYKLEGTTKVNEVHLATSVAELTET
jgi:hypothetical protein